MQLSPTSWPGTASELVFHARRDAAEARVGAVLTGGVAGLPLLSRHSCVSANGSGRRRLPELRFLPIASGYRGVLTIVVTVSRNSFHVTPVTVGRGSAACFGARNRTSVADRGIVGADLAKNRVQMHGLRSRDIASIGSEVSG